MNLLAEEVRLVGQQNFRAFNLPQIENQGGNFLGGCTRGVGEAMQEISECKRFADNAIQDILLVWLERESSNLGLPVLQVLQLWAGCIARNLLSPITDRTSVFIKLFDFAPSNLEAFAMVPVKYC